MLIGKVWVFILGNIIAGTAHNLKQLVAGRLFSGVAGQAYHLFLQSSSLVSLLLLQSSNCPSTRRRAL